MSAKPDSHRPGHREATPVTRKEGTFFLPSGPAKLTFFNQLRLADFAECMRSLGYPRVISMENFRSPNFELVADCLEFLVTRYDETAVVDGDISTEKDRVHFLKNVNRAFSQKVTSISQSTHSASLFTARYGVRNIYYRTQSTGNCYADPLRRTPFQSRNTRYDRLTLSCYSQKARIKLNLKRLYSADGAAVKELLKIAEVLRKAVEAAADGENDIQDGDGAKDDETATNDDANNTFDKLFDVKAIRKLAGDVTNAGAKTFDCLRHENDSGSRVARVNAVQGTVEIGEIEKAVQSSILGVKENQQRLERGLVDLAKDTNTLRLVLEKRKDELDRSTKRLGTLQAARPAHQDEFDTLQNAMPTLYAEYLERHANLAYLETALDERRGRAAVAAAAREDALRKMRGRLRETEMRVLRGEDAAIGGDGDGEGNSDSEDEFGDAGRQGASGGSAGGFGKPKTTDKNVPSARAPPTSASSAGRRAPRRFGLGGGVVGGEVRKTAQVTKQQITGSMMGGDPSDSDDGIQNDGDDGTSSDENDF
jgi:clusterin-associated protein 1